MLTASVYIAFCSARNRIRVRLRRLREPRYLFGAIAGAAYFYFAVFRRSTGGRAGRGRNGNNRPPFEVLSALQVAGTSLAGLGVFVCALVPWILPMKSGLLQFSRAEKAMLFPAPVSRRQLLMMRLVRSQTGSLVASLFVALFAGTSGVGRVRLAISVWVMLVTVRIYNAGVILVRARLASPVASVRRAAWLPIGLLMTGGAILTVSIARQLVPFPGGAADIVVHLSRATASGLAHVVLWPFIAILRPAIATTLLSFLVALVWALGVLAVVTAWMLTSDAMFDLVAGDAVELGIKQTSAGLAAPRAREVGWKLAPSGRIESLLFWKNAMQTFRGTSGVLWRVAISVFTLMIGAMAVGLRAAGQRGPAGFLSMFALIAAAIAVFFGPQMMRTDLRTDFEHLDLLKTWPARASDVIRGEIAWPALVVSVVACVAVLVGAIFSGTALPDVPFVSRWSFAVAALFAAPALVAAQYVVHNAATIFFPAWVALGTQRTRGIDAMGQRLIMLAAILLALLLFAVPGALVGAAIWLVFAKLVGNVIFVPIAVLFAAIVFVEVLVVTELLGPAYERIDLTSIERGES